MKVILDTGDNYYAEIGSDIKQGDILEVHTEDGKVSMCVMAVHVDNATCRNCCLDLHKGCYGIQCFENSTVFKNASDLMEDI